MIVQHDVGQLPNLPILRTLSVYFQLLGALPQLASSLISWRYENGAMGRVVRVEAQPDDGVSSSIRVEHLIFDFCAVGGPVSE